MIDSIKSWWYWNITSKYDGLDIFMFTFFPLLIVAMIVVGVMVHEEKKQNASICESKGGVLMSTHRSYYCIDVKAIIK